MRIPNATFSCSCEEWSIRTLLVCQKLERIGFSWDIPARGGIVENISGQCPPDTLVAKSLIGFGIFWWHTTCGHWLDICRHQVSMSFKGERGDTLDTLNTRHLCLSSKPKLKVTTGIGGVGKNLTNECGKWGKQVLHETWDKGQQSAKVFHLMVYFGKHLV